MNIPLLRSRDWIGPAIAVAVALGACAKSAPPQHEPPLVRITAHEFAYDMPDTLPAGLVRVRVVNDGGYWHHALFARLDSMQTAEGYLKEIRAGADFPSGATDMGGTPLIVPGDSSESVLSFTPGRWIALCTASGGGMWHVAAGMLAPFVVVADPAAAPASPPASDVTLVMNDSTFVVPDTLVAGTRWLRVENRGRRWHECDILRLEPGTGFADYVAWRRTEHLGRPRVATPVGGVADFGPGVVIWTRTEFRPGPHLFVCDMPGDSAHHRIVEVVAAR